MYRTYLSTLRYKRLSKKMNLAMVEPLAAPLATWLFAIETKHSPPHVCNGLVKVAVEGLI
jgi:hypothetical protein